MRRQVWILALLTGCQWPEYWLDPENPCKIDSPVDIFVDAPAVMAPKTRGVMRVVVTESDGTAVRPKSGAKVTVRLGETKLFEGTTVDGSVAAAYEVPDLPDGNYTLRVDAGPYELKHAVAVKRDTRILLTTDKPVYQPGQTMRLRAIALANVTLKPVEREKLTFEVEDAKGNKVFKRPAETSEFGIAHADFPIADEVCMGDWKVSAILGSLTSERTVAVKRYVLPKFRVTIETDRPFYLPGEKLVGTIQADYFFGKPVAGADAVVKLLAVDAEVREIAKAQVKTDASGRATFEIALDTYFVGLPINKGQANALLAAQVTDTAGHAEKAARPVPVAREALQIAAVPESGKLVPGVENRIYVATYTPDGRPVSCDVTIALGDQSQSGATDEGGVAVLMFTPGVVSRAVITASDKTGRRTRATIDLQRGEMGLLLRPDRALYDSGKTMNLEVFSAVRRGQCFIDLVRAGQTLLTTMTPLEEGRARYAFDIPAEVFGAVEVRAYVILQNGDVLRDSRLVYIRQANELAITVTPSKDVYEPGEDAAIAIKVSERAALGISIVDEAVYALQEMRPGLEKVYFMIEKELQEPKFGIKTLPETIELAQDRLAAMLLASAETNAQPAPSGVEIRWRVNTLEQRGRIMEPRLRRWKRVFETYIVKREGPFAVQEDGVWRFRKGLLEDIKFSERSFLRPQDLVDAWGNPMTLETLEKSGAEFNVDTWLKLRGIK